MNPKLVICRLEMCVALLASVCALSGCGPRHEEAELVVDARVKQGDQTVRLSSRGPNWAAEIARQAKPDEIIGMELVGEGWNDRQISKLQRFPSLTSLSIINAPITDSAVRQLARLPNLKRLYLENTKITDQGVVEFSSFPALEWLGIPGTPPSEAAIEGLLEAAPKLKVERAYRL